MTWQVEFTDRARRELRKLGALAQQSVLSFLRKRIVTEEDPRRFGKSLRGDFTGLWRYRVRDHRIIAKIEDEKLKVLVIKVGHRKNIYN